MLLHTLGNVKINYLKTSISFTQPLTLLPTHNTHLRTTLKLQIRIINEKLNLCIPCALAERS